MPILIREVLESDLPALQALTVAAFEPIFASFAKIMGEKVFPLVYPDWKSTQSNLVETFFKDEKIHLFLAEHDGKPSGLLAYQLEKGDEKTGEIEFLVVHPDYQKEGIGTKLNEFALTKMREAGMKLVVVGTGGDESHAPARKAYEKVGFRPLPSVWYFMALD
jgi:ribosomal protein S18 acetylase RimI-like enzyme